jgi:hypothetical protein
MVSAMIANHMSSNEVEIFLYGSSLGKMTFELDAFFKKKLTDASMLWPLWVLF